MGLNDVGMIHLKKVVEEQLLALVCLFQLLFMVREGEVGVLELKLVYLLMQHFKVYYANVVNCHHIVFC